MMHKLPRWAWVVVVFLLLSGCKSDDPLKPKKPDNTLTFFSTTEWEKVLNAVVTPDGYVQWNLLQSNKNEVRDGLIRFVGILGAASPDNRSELFASAGDQQAYWINAYNALAMYAVMRHDYPATVEGISADHFLVGGKSLSLQEIEEKKLDAATHPQIYFVLNQDAMSSPPLKRTPYDGAVIAAQLQDQTQVYLRDPRAAVRSGDQVLLSELILMHQAQIVTWVNQGLLKYSGDLLEALNWMASPESPIHSAKSFRGMKFDWSLNRPPR